jgi:hypothetical protein
MANTDRYVRALVRVAVGYRKNVDGSPGGWLAPAEHVDFDTGEEAAEYLAAEFPTYHGLIQVWEAATPPAGEPFATATVKVADPALHQEIVEAYVALRKKAEPA